VSVYSDSIHDLMAATDRKILDELQRMANAPMRPTTILMTHDLWDETVAWGKDLLRRGTPWFRPVGPFSYDPTWKERLRQVWELVRAIVG
jgi:hypothetical protein